MITTANQNARQYVNNRIGFKGNNTFAEWINGVVYKVYSYGYHFPMYAYKAGQWYANRDKYSRTTSKHQSQCRPTVNDMIELSTEEMKGL